MTSTRDQLLTRYWFLVPGIAGFGVTAYSLPMRSFCWRPKVSWSNRTLKSWKTLTSQHWTRDMFYQTQVHRVFAVSGIRVSISAG